MLPRQQRPASSRRSSPGSPHQALAAHRRYCSRPLCAPAAAGGRQQRRAVLLPRCQARRAPARPSSPPRGGRKGFGPAKTEKKQQQEWETQLLPAYRTYYKAGFKPPRFQGAIKLHTFEDGSVGVVASEEVITAELLAVSHPLAFLDGSLGSAPPVEDLHAALLEAQASDSVQKVLRLLPRKPGAAATRDAAAAAAAGALAPPPAQPLLVEALPQQQEQQQQQQAEPLQPQPQQELAQQLPEAQPPQPQRASDPPAAAQDPGGPDALSGLAELVPAYWEAVGLPRGSVKPLSSRQLMRTLQASCYSEDFRDPAASQVRHERPVGHIGVWPELSLLRHSCAPTASAVVVDRYLLLHATADLKQGDEVTFNKLGSTVALPLAARQAAHMELFGQPCRCHRCQLEEGLSADAAAALQSVSAKATAEWPDRLNAALQSSGAGELGDEEVADLLGDLQMEVTESLLDLNDTLAAELPDRESQLLVQSAAYNAADLAWNIEELLAEEPDLDVLALCVAQLRLFARGSEGHTYTALLLDQAYTARAQALNAKVQGMARKTAARQRRLTAEISQLLASADMAAYCWGEAMMCRYGLLPKEGLIDQLAQGLSLFYAGLSALSAAAGEGLDEVPEVTRSLTIEGIPVTVVDTVDGSLYASRAAEDGGAEGGEGGGAGGGEDGPSSPPDAVGAAAADMS